VKPNTNQYVGILQAATLFDDDGIFEIPCNHLILKSL